MRQARPFTAGGASQQLQQQRVAAAPRRSPSTQQQRARRRAPPVPQAVGAHDLTATLLEQVTSLALRARLKEARAVSTEISCDAMSLLAGRVNSVTIKGEGWRSPLDLTAQLLECSVGAAALDYSRVLAGQIVLTNVPTGTARVVFDERDFGNFLAHPLVARQAAAAVKGAPFDFDRASVRLEAPSAARPGGAVYFTGTCRADGGRYQVELLPVARASGGGGGGSGLAAAGWPGVQAHAIALGVGGRASE